MCLFALLVAFAPRIALLLTWILTPLVNRAFGSFLVPLLGLIFLPLTTLVYVFAFVPGVGLTAWGWFWLVLAFLLDVSAYGTGAFGRRSRKSNMAYG